MNFLDFKVFDQYIKGNHQVISTYLLLLSDSFERKMISEHIKNYYPDFELYSFDSLEENLPKLLEEIRTPSLFSSKKIFFIEEASVLKKGEFPLKALPRDTILVFTSSSKKNYLESALLEKGAILDLLKEKPWERERRLIDFMATIVLKQGKSMSPSLYPLLLEKVGPDLASLKQQIDMLVCYIGSRPSIEKTDIEKIVEVSDTQTAWKMGEDIVWKLSWKFSPKAMDTHLFYSLLSAMRYQMQLGLGLSLLIAKGEKDLASYFPKIYPTTLKKRIDEVKAFSTSYFEKGLLELFKIELLSKCNTHSFSAYIDQLVVKLTYY